MIIERPKTIPTLDGRVHYHPIDEDQLGNPILESRKELQSKEYYEAYATALVYINTPLKEASVEGSAVSINQLEQILETGDVTGSGILVPFALSSKAGWTDLHFALQNTILARDDIKDENDKDSYFPAIIVYDERLITLDNDFYLLPQESNSSSQVIKKIHIFDFVQPDEGYKNLNILKRYRKSTERVESFAA